MGDVLVSRHLVFADASSQREVARRFGIPRDPVARDLDQPEVPGVRVEGPRPKPAQDAFSEGVIPGARARDPEAAADR